MTKIGRNDPCPCGSGKKYKQCCIVFPAGKRKIKATVITGKKPEQPRLAPDLVERAFADILSKKEEVEVKNPEENSKEGDSDSRDPKTK